MTGLSSFTTVIANIKMVSFTPETVFLCLATVFVASEAVNATIFPGTTQEEAPVAEDRIFKAKKLAPLLAKKKKLHSLFAKTAQPQIVHTLSPIEHYPIWKVHKYKGIELRPVQVVDIPSPFDYSPVQPDYYQSGAQYGAEPVRAPHTEYGVPGHNSFATGGVITDGGDFHHTHHGGKLKALLALLRSHGGLITKLKNLKSWKLGLKQGPGPFAYGYGAPLPEVHEIPVGGLENLNLQVPELPALGLSNYGSAITGGPYVKVQVASPTPVVNYATPVYQPQYAPQYEYQYPPQSDQYPVRAPAPYYGAPPLFNSYGMPLPADAYSSASSDQVLSFAVPENTQQTQDPVPVIEEEFTGNNNGTLTVAGSAQVGELPGAKFVTEEKEEKVGDVIDQSIKS